MKTWPIVLSLLCAAGIALAGDPVPAPAAPPDPAAAQPQAAPIAEKAAPAKPKRHKHARKAKHLPRGDLRQCLELKDNKAIIACSEKRKND